MNNIYLLPDLYKLHLIALSTLNLFNVSSTNLEQSKLCVNGPLYIDTRLFGEQTIGCNSA